MYEKIFILNTFAKPKANFCTIHREINNNNKNIHGKYIKQYIYIKKFFFD